MRLLIMVFCGATFWFAGTDKVQAQTLGEMIRGNQVPNCLPGRQSDDYCGKPFPWAVPVCGGLCDDYCDNKMPCTRRVCQFTCDDYCAKSIPRVCKSQCSELECGCNRIFGKACDGHCQNPLPQRRVIAANRSPFTAPFSLQRLGPRQNKQQTTAKHVVEKTLR